jgi:uncharacterized damage-inducible protein DinB
MVSACDAWRMQTVDIQALFDFLYWRRDRVLAGADALGTASFVDPAGTASRDLRGTLVHELDVERSWRLRLQGTPDAEWDQTLDVGDYPAVRVLREQWVRDETEMRAWIAGLSDADLAAPVTVNRLDGFALEAYLTHVVMHGIQSFSEAGVLLAAAGHSVGDVDFLDSYDDRGPSGG